MLLPSQQSPEDQKKTRNRLAQRKHRQRKFVLLQCAKTSRLCFWAVRHTK